MSAAGSDRSAEAAPARVALVTGGAVRVGRAIALGLAEAGWDVAISYHSSSDAAEEVRARVASLGRRSLAVGADLAEPEAPARVVDAVAAEFGALDLLVNSAASFRSAGLLDVTREEWDDVMALNLRAPFLLVRRAAPMLRRAQGTVVNIVDLSALQPWTSHPHHSVSKAGLLHLTKVMARSLAPEVRVNAVAPGHVLAPSGEGAAPAARATRSAARLAPPGEGAVGGGAKGPAVAARGLAAEAAGAVLERPGRPEDVVEAVRFLTDARFVTGDVVVCDGGQLLRT